MGLGNALKGHTKTISTMTVSDDGQILASAGQDRTIRFWNAHDGTELAVIKDLNGWVEGIAFLPDSHVLVSGEDKGEIHFWDADTLREPLPALRYIPEIINDHPFGISDIAVSATKNEIHLAAGGYGNRLQIWKL
jgi:WD40 repeat protein